MFTELLRLEWGLPVDPVQWNAVSTEEGVLRGVHVHPRHDDYLILLSGRASIGLCDLRRVSPTAGLATIVPLDSAQPGALTIPHGVAHGFLFHQRSLHAYAVSHYWSPADELHCRWDDPELGIPWPRAPRTLSDADAAAPPLARVRAELDARLRPVA